MLNFVFRLLLTFNATSLFLIIYAVNNEVTLNSILPGVLWLKEIPAMFSGSSRISVGAIGRFRVAGAGNWQ